jgi:DNA-binding CsgD family transcriptional regulator
VLTPFQLSPVLALLERHAPHRTAHASLIAGIRSLLAGTGLAPRPSLPGPLTEPLSGSEVRLRRYLPTNLSLPEIARELSVSPHTVKSHIRSLYAKPGAYRRSGAVETARALGLLAPVGAGLRPASPHRPEPPSGLQSVRHDHDRHGAAANDGRGDCRRGHWIQQEAPGPRSTGSWRAGSLPCPRGSHTRLGEVASSAGSDVGSAPDRSWRLIRITASAMIAASARTPAETS